MELGSGFRDQKRKAPDTQNRYAMIVILLGYGSFLQVDIARSAVCSRASAASQLASRHFRTPQRHLTVPRRHDGLCRRPRIACHRLVAAPSATPKGHWSAHHHIALSFQGHLSAFGPGPAPAKQSAVSRQVADGLVLQFDELIVAEQTRVGPKSPVPEKNVRRNQFK